MLDLEAIRDGFRNDKMGYIAGILAGPILYVGIAIATLL